MTLLQHLAVRRGLAKKRNPNGIIGITVGDAAKIIEEFKDMRRQRDEALASAGIARPKKEKKSKEPKAPVEATKAKIDPRWAKVLRDLK